ncbi:ATP-binding protein [Candidatus Omnitrophota bacterium]
MKKKKRNILTVGAGKRDKALEKGIEKVARDWERTFDSIKDLVFILDKDFNIIRINKTGINLLKLRPEDIIGKKCHKIFHKLNKPWPNCPYWKCKKDKNVHIEEVGDPNIGIPLLVTASPIFDDKGGLIGSVHIARDIARQKKNEKILQDAKGELEIQAWGLKKTNEAIKLLYKELEEKNKKLQEFDQLKSEFISTVSHELRTPLTITKEGISIILDEIPGKVNEEQTKILTMALEHINRLTRIINDLLDISKIEARKIELIKRPVDIKVFMQKLIFSLEIKVKQKSLELKANLPEEEIIVYVDPDKLMQVFTNLVYNALKFTHQGFIEISVKNREDDIECSVNDTGIGVSKENLPRVFDKFQQFGRTPGSGEKGTGLGLPITKGIIEMHNGAIWAESKLGKGTRFIFTLPKYTARVIFREHVNDSVKEAIGKGSKMCLVIVSMKTFDRAKNKFSEEKMDTILEDAKGILEKSFRHAGDMVFKGPDMVGISLRECDKKGGFKVKTRSEKLLKDYLVRKQLADVIKVQFGYAVYPDEAHTDKELIRKAMSE